MRHSEQCDHLYCKLKLRFGHYATLPILIAAAAVLLLLVFCFRACSQMADSSEVKNAALDFAEEIKRTQSSARQSKHMMAIKLVPATSDASASYQVLNGDHVLSSINLPASVYGSGKIEFDPDGRPLTSESFVLHKGTHTVKIDVDVNGVISFP